MTTVQRDARKWCIVERRIVHGMWMTKWSTKWHFGNRDTSEYHDCVHLPRPVPQVLSDFVVGAGDDLQHGLNHMDQWRTLFEVPQIVVTAAFNRNIHLTIHGHLDRNRTFGSPGQPGRVQYKWVFTSTVCVGEVDSVVPLVIKLLVEQPPDPHQCIRSVQSRHWNDRRRAWQYGFTTECTIHTDVRSVAPLAAPVLRCCVHFPNENLYLLPSEIGHLKRIYPEEEQMWNIIQKMSNAEMATRFILMARQLICKPVSFSQIAVSILRNHAYTVWPDYALWFNIQLLLLTVWWIWQQMKMYFHSVWM